jgi:nicotinate-nucleotide adenylyltransferase
VSVTRSQVVRRLGVYGGAFDPPHQAHEALAQQAVMQFQLDELRIMPTGQAWYKTRPLTAAEHRLRMAQIAFEDVPQVKVDARETLRPGPSYTIDTLLELRAEHPEAELFLLMGQDQFEFFPQWHRYEDILQIATILVALRADSVRADAQKEHENHVKIKHQTILMRPSSISATEIRERCQTGAHIDHLVKPGVARYIERHALYRSA